MLDPGSNPEITSYEGNVWQVNEKGGNGNAQSSSGGMWGSYAVIRREYFGMPAPCPGDFESFSAYAFLRLLRARKRRPVQKIPHNPVSTRVEGSGASTPPA